MSKESERALRDAALLITERDGKRVCRARDKCSHAGKIERTRSLPEVIVEKLAVFAANFQ